VAAVVAVKSACEFLKSWLYSQLHVKLSSKQILRIFAAAAAVAVAEVASTF